MASLLDRVAPPRLGGGFRWLLASSWSSNLGDGLAVAAGPLLVASLTRDPRLVAAAAAVQWIPGAVLGLYAGALADRYDRRRIILWGNAARVLGLSMLTALIGAGRAGIGTVLLVLFLVAVVETFVDSASRTVLPMIVPKADLGIAAARFTFGWVGLNQLIGAPVGAALFALGPAWPFAAQTVLMGLGGVLIARVLLPPVPRGPRRHVLHEIAEGLAWSWRHRAMRALVLQILLFNLTYGASWGVLVLYAAQHLRLDELGFGAMTLATALGSLLGTVTYGWLTRHVSIADIMRYGLILETLTHLALALTSSPAVALVVLFLFGIHIAYWATTASAVRQRAIPMALQGRVGAVYVMAMLGGMAAGSALGGVLADRWGILAPYWFGFVGSAILTALLWRELGHVAHEDAKILAAEDDSTEAPQ